MPPPARLKSPPPRSRRRRTAAGRLGGLLTVGAALAAAAALGTLPEAPPPGSVATPLFIALGLGGLAVLAPWSRLAPGWLHLLPASGTALVAWAVAEHPGRALVLAPLYLVAAAYAAYAFSRPAAALSHLALAVAALAAPLAYAPAGDPELAVRTATLAVALVAVTGLMVALREREEAGRTALRELAESDPLTGVGNYRRLYGRLTYEVARHRRSGRPLALLLLDLDGFKAVNDDLGHPAGDRLLKEIARALQATVRAQDTVARQGGDEFAVLAPETGSQAAAALAGRIEHALAGVAPDGVAVRASVGWAIYPQDGEERMVLLESADARQRAAKRARRASGTAQARISA